MEIIKLTGKQLIGKLLVQIHALMLILFKEVQFTNIFLFHMD